MVPSENSVAFYLALHKAQVPAELHIFQKGPHGVGLDLGDPALGEWPKLLLNWLRGLGIAGEMIRMGASPEAPSACVARFAMRQLVN